MSPQFSVNSQKITLSLLSSFVFLNFLLLISLGIWYLYSWSSLLKWPTLQITDCEMTFDICGKNTGNPDDFISKYDELSKPEIKFAEKLNTESLNQIYELARSYNSNPLIVSYIYSFRPSSSSLTPEVREQEVRAICIDLQKRSNEHWAQYINSQTLFYSQAILGWDRNNQAKAFRGVTEKVDNNSLILSAAIAARAEYKADIYPRINSLTAFSRFQ